MKILFASVEVAPFAKVGGLADVAGSLPKALAALGHDVRILMPAYQMVVEGQKPLAHGIPVPVNPHWHPATDLYEMDLEGVPVWLVGRQGIFDETFRSEEVYRYGRDAYLFFAQAALSVCEHQGWIPDVIHANDWHTGFLPVFLREKAGEKWDKTASVYTIHNLLYQGEFGHDTLDAAGLPQSLFTMDRLETFGAVNFLKSACVYSDRVNTVSPTYAEEITTAEYGAGQWGLMGALKEDGRLRGILNGIDTDFFNPETDRYTAGKFSPQDLSGKVRCKEELQKELGLPVEQGVALAGVVSRLSDQKGFDLMVRQAYGMLNLPVQWVVLGTGDPWAANQLRMLEREWPESVRFIERYDAPLAQRIYAGSDMFLMPSAFEPCGLGQMIACRYGTVPVVRATGGLADSIHDGVNGIVFKEKSARQLLIALERAMDLYRSPEWPSLVQRCMETDFGWDKSAKLYEEMYADALAARAANGVRELSR